ncbi:gfo/Idh/MocA family oxidoreductase [Adhaeribacter arboris]|uniref:Gfo/Idh/MocA family oxidoreductase n=1 Tax=Adhaeribacter arboris TaxID=2072846 RepID=A0A2T2YNH6_9BACT|nr:Gfo/Idh/MocA family oxidoreductase [Adhaeribacter arboris]PSR57046.1 gfo/Idh/MocA family oxidoreductase [Adhaeribacter arboris]
MKKLKFAVFGTGFWSYYQLSGWQELPGVEPIALYNRTQSRAEEVARTFNVPHVYDDPDELLQQHAAELDFMDIITDVDTHALFTEKGAAQGLAVICQKPMAPTLETARRMVTVCKNAGVKLYIHENFRWQAPIRKVKEILDSGLLGKLFRARVTFVSAFPVFQNQPFLAELEEFILTDIGSHILDICRFLFGEVASLYCQTNRVNSQIKGEDVAHVLLRMQNGISCFAEMSYASLLEKEAFPQTLVQVEGEHGSLILTHDFQIKITTRQGTNSTAAEPQMYSWVDPAYAVVHSSIVDCNRNILEDLLGNAPAETTGDDNFQTVRLVHAAYESARTNKVVSLF